MNRRRFLGALLGAFAGAVMIKSIGQLALAAPEPEESEATKLWKSTSYTVGGEYLCKECGRIHEHGVLTMSLLECFHQQLADGRIG